MLFKNSGITKLSQEEEINKNKQRRNHKRMKRYGTVEKERLSRVEDTISEVGRQTTVPDHGPAGKSEIATRDVSPDPLSSSTKGG